jgi:predicted acylesterase/phospholipase RssA
MLGRLRMSLDQCERAYLTLSEKIFTPKRSKRQFIGRAKDFLLANGRFDAEVLEAAMKECIGEFESTDALLKDPNSPCKVSVFSFHSIIQPLHVDRFVVTTRESNAALALIRSYNNTKRTAVLYDECKIWEACRATSAATTFFDPVQIGSRQQKFIDGAVRYNNPIQQVYNEAMDLDQSRETFILSIGTGSAPGKAFEGKLKDIVEAMKIIVTETEQKAQDFSDNHRNLVDDNMLFRFNVYHGLKEVGLEEYKEIPAMADATETYLDHLDTRKQLRTCVSKLSQILQQG